MPDDQRLLDTLAMVRERGPIGEASLEAAVAHADRFVAAIPATARTLADLGSGGGLPGLVIAWRRPDLSVTLVERRASRADLLVRAARRLGCNPAVWAGDVADLVRAGAHFDVVTARRFGPSAVTARWAAALLDDLGVLLVSEPPSTSLAVASDRWSAAIDHGLIDEGERDGIRQLRRVPRGT